MGSDYFHDSVPKKKRRVEGEAHFREIRGEVGSVLALWEQLHPGDRQPQATSEQLLNRLHTIISGKHRAAKLSLAACMKGLLLKVVLSAPMLLKLVTSMLSAVCGDSTPLATKACAEILPLLHRVLASDHLRQGQSEEVRQSFMTLTLSVLALCTEGSPHESELIRAARDAFACRPLWFIRALTDALEDPNHAALPGAVHFGLSELCHDADASLFTTVLKDNSSVAGQVDKLLRSCINEVRTKTKLKASVALMSQLLQLVPNSSNPLPSVPSRPWHDSASLLTSSLSLPKRTSSELPYPPKPNPSLQHSASAPPGHWGSLPAPMSAAEAPEAPSAPRVAAPPAPRSLVTRVAPCIAIGGLEKELTNGTLRRWTRRNPHVVAAECVGNGVAVLQYSSMQRAVEHMGVLHMHAAEFGLVAVDEQAVASFARLTDMQDNADWVWLPGVRGDTFACVMRVLFRAKMPVPKEYMLVDGCASGCLVAWEGVDAADRAVAALTHWLSELAQPTVAPPVATPPVATPTLASPIPLPPAGPSTAAPMNTHQSSLPAVPVVKTEPAAPVVKAEPSVPVVKTEPAVLQESGSGALAAQPVSTPVATADGAAALPAPTPTAPMQSSGLWSGQIGKNSTVQCHVYMGMASEHVQTHCWKWPEMLDMRNRIELNRAIQAWQATNEDARGWAWLHATQPGDPGMTSFIDYLRQRQRAGVVRPSTPDNNSVVYILNVMPPEGAFCEAVGAPVETDSVLLLMRVLPHNAA